MAIGLRRVDRHVDAPTAAVWRLLVDLDAWPEWGPTVHRAALEDAEELEGGVRGGVDTRGLSLPFTITRIRPRSAVGVVGRGGAGHRARGPSRRAGVPGAVRGAVVGERLPSRVCAVALGRIEKMAVAPAAESARPR